jgi:hypothetical protein
MKKFKITCMSGDVAQKVEEISGKYLKKNFK